MFLEEGDDRGYFCGTVREQVWGEDAFHKSRKALLHRGAIPIDPDAISVFILVEFCSKFFGEFGFSSGFRAWKVNSGGLTGSNLVVKVVRDEAELFGASLKVSVCFFHLVPSGVTSLGEFWTWRKRGCGCCFYGKITTYWVCEPYLVIISGKVCPKSFLDQFCKKIFEKS